MRRLIPVCLLLLLAIPAGAQIDPEPDGIGIYADLAATANEVSAPVGEAFEVYLMLTRPSATTPISCWECGIVVPDNVVIWGWNIAGDHINLGNGSDFAVCFNEPRPLADAMLLMTIIVVAVDAEPGFFSINAGSRDSGDDGVPNYIAEGTNYALETLHAWPSGVDLPCLAFNGADITPVDVMAFDQVKALYR